MESLTGWWWSKLFFLPWTLRSGLADETESTNGNLWVAVYATGSVMVFTPEGKCLKQVRLPARYLTCPTWGGKNHDILFVTTARDRTENPDPSDDGGHIYMFRPNGASGRAKYEFGG